MELLIVIAIMGVLTTLSMAAFSSLMTANHLNEATAIVQGQLELARQTAKTLNRSVQLRLYQDQNNTSTAPSIDSLQIVVPAENSTTESDEPIEKPILLPQSTIIADSTNDLSLTSFSNSGPPSNPPTSNSFNPLPPANFIYCYILTFSTTGAITTPNTSGNPVSPAPNDSTVYCSLSVVPQKPYRAQGSSAKVGGMQNYATFYLNSINGTYSVTRP
ncbi:MAG: hypothetical protein LV481_04830 [Methylacidiphilales bacterium]|nr:hypothetical protein [Candidatus Methylacidiphilales bacterium]